MSLKEDPLLRMVKNNTQWPMGSELGSKWMMRGAISAIIVESKGQKVRKKTGGKTIKSLAYDVLFWKIIASGWLLVAEMRPPIYVLSTLNFQSMASWIEQPCLQKSRSMVTGGRQVQRIWEIVYSEACKLLCEQIKERRDWVNKYKIKQRGDAYSASLVAFGERLPWTLTSCTECLLLSQNFIKYYTHCWIYNIFPQRRNLIFSFT